MKNCKLYFFWMTILLLCTSIGNTYAQAELSRSYQRKVSKAEFFIYEKKYEKAEKLYAKALTEHRSDLWAIRNYVQLFTLSEESSNRIETLQRVANQNNPKINEVIALPFIQLLVEKQEVGLLRQYAAQFKANLDPKHPLQDKLTFLQNVNLLSEIEVHSLDVAVNDSLDIKFPHLAFQEQQIIYTRNSPNHAGRFYTTIGDSCYGWTSPIMLDFPFNNLNPQEGFYVSPDSRYILFSRCDLKPYRPDHGGGCDIYFSFYQNNEWSFPKPLGPAVNTYHDELHPYLSPDLKTLYFSSNRPDGYGGYDLYKSEFKDGQWSEAENLGPKVNSKGNEIAPFLHVDNQHLFFSSDGHPGFGGFDFFKSQKTAQENWSIPKNLGAGINSYADEMGLTIALDGRKVYFSSNRKDAAFPGYNLYEAKGHFGLSPHQYISGKLYDSLKHYELHHVQVIQNPIYNWPLSNEGDGSYYMIQSLAHVEPIRFSLEGYLEQQITLDTLQGSFNNHFNIPLLSERDAANMFDTLYVRLSEDKLNDDFSSYFESEWPEVYRFLSNRNIMNVNISKGTMNQFGKEFSLTFEHEDINLIESILSPAWVPAHKIFFLSPSTSQQAKNEKDPYFIDIEIISSLAE